MAASYVHLHNHSEYSLLDGIARVQDIAKRLKELDYDAYALTDHGVMYGSMEFYLGMREAGIKPIIGCEVYVAQRKLTDRDSELDRKSWHCVLLASNEEGYVNLMKLTSIAHRFGQYYKPRVDVDAIREYNAGLICLTACPNGVVAGPFHRLPEDDRAGSRGSAMSGMPGGPDAARDAIETYMRIFGPERMFLELQNHGMEIERSYREWAQQQAAHFGLRLVATNDCHYVNASDATAHDVCLCLRDKKLLSDTDRLRYSGPDYYIKTPEEMQELFKDLPEALANTVAVADLCNLELDLKKVHFPQFEVPVLTAGGTGRSAGQDSAIMEGGTGRSAGQDLAQKALVGQVAATVDDFRNYVRHLPHWRLSGSTYFVTWRVHPNQPDLPDAARDIVVEALHFSDTERYNLLSYVVMNDHVHVILKPEPGIELEKILHTWKSFTANRIQREVGWSGPVWQNETWDRIVRDEDELFEKSTYIINNPRKRWPELTGYRWQWQRLGAASEVKTGTAAGPTIEPDPHPAFSTDQAAQDAYLRKLVYEGAERRYGTVTEALRERIEYELGVIIPKGFTTYFLICADFCGFARSQNIPVGPGRGSAAGSVVAYCLEITDLDPIKYGLYFERFLNPERIELPDADIDFCFRRREEVIEHVKRKYGADRVAMIVTYSRLKARAVIKAVGRTKGLEYQYVDRVTKEISGLNPTLDEAIAGSAVLQKMIRDDRNIAELVEDSRRLEGIAAHHSVHAAGLVIAPTEISNFVPVQPLKDSDLLVTQYAMDTVPKTGLVKFDFLGLRNLTMIQDAVDYIFAYTGTQIDPRVLPENDPETYAMLQRGDGYGVFQFEAPQVKRMLIDGRPTTLEDLAAITSANRPGPITSGNTERYLQNRKAGVAGTSLYPSIEDILEPTGGVMLFQEQVLEVARKLGGFSLGEADLLRKAMGKKSYDVMAKQQEKFVAGALEKGIAQREVDAIWDMMLQFAGYGFNKAHAMCYAYIAYQTAYLKCHYPHFFMCAMLNSYVGNSAKLAEILAQCRRMRITVLPPSVNSGKFEFTPTATGQIVFGLGGIKGIGRAAVDTILSERTLRGSYASLADFNSRLKGQGINKKVLQSLAQAGALDGLGADRGELIRNLDNIESFMRGPDRQVSMFGDLEDDDSAGSVLISKEVTDFDIAMAEKRAIGLFLSYHPFADHAMYSDKRFWQLDKLQEEIRANPQRWQDRSLPSMGLVGLLTDVSVRTANTSNKQYAKGRLEDPERSAALVVWPKAYEQGRDCVFENCPVVVYGRVQVPEIAEDGDEAWDGLEIIADRIEAYPMPEARSEPAEPQTAVPQAQPELPPATAPVRAAPPVAPATVYPTIRKLNGAETIPPPESSPPVVKQILWELDLQGADMDSLARLVKLLEHTSGDCELLLNLREVSGDIKRVRAHQRFFTTPQAAEEIASRFGFIKSV